MSTSKNSSEYELKILFNEYLQECQFTSRLRPATTKGYKALFDMFLDIMPEVSKAEFLTPIMMIEFFKRLQTRTRTLGNTVQSGVKNSTIRTYWSKLNSFFVWLTVKNYLKSNPLRHIKRPPEPQYEDSRALKDEEVDRIISAVVVHAKSTLALRRDSVIISLLLYCGLRRGELIELQVRDVDLAKGNLIVRGETSKSKKTRILPIHPTLAMHLKEYLAERIRHRYTISKLLVSTTNGDVGLTRNGLRHWEKRFNLLSGVKFHLHRFRHSFATNLAIRDVGIVKIQKLLGHSSLSMTERYVRSITPEDLQEDINKL